MVGQINNRIIHSDIGVNRSNNTMSTNRRVWNADNAIINENNGTNDSSNTINSRSFFAYNKIINIYQYSNPYYPPVCTGSGNTGWGNTGFGSGPWAPYPNPWTCTSPWTWCPWSFCFSPFLWTLGSCLPVF